MSAANGYTGPGLYWVRWHLGSARIAYVGHKTDPWYARDWTAVWLTSPDRSEVAVEGRLATIATMIIAPAAECRA